MMGSTLRTALAASVGIVLAIPAGRAQAVPEAGFSPGCTAAAKPDRFQNLTPDGDLLLSSGRTARLAGVRLPDEGPHREQALAWLQGRRGEPIAVQDTAGPDRWSRVSVRIRSEDRTTPLDWSHGLVESGLAITDAAHGPFCQPELLALEATARERRLGVWADDRYKPVDAMESERLRGRIGSFVLVEGRVRSIGERKERTYLNFGEHWAEDFTIIIPRTTWKQMSDRGMGAEALRGRRIRARGILQPWQGTTLSVSIPDMIERLEGSRLPR